MQNTTLPEPMVLVGDTPRTRRSNPGPAHLAADATQSDLAELHEVVLHILRMQGPLTDSELVRYYRLHRETEGWRDVLPETVRKRRSDLASKRFGLVVGTGETRTNQHTNPETVWGLR